MQTNIVSLIQACNLDFNILYEHPVAFVGHLISIHNAVL
jgi:hypothetical protein